MNNNKGALKFLIDERFIFSCNLATLLIDEDIILFKRQEQKVV